MDSIGHQLSPECRNITQLPTARKLQVFEVRGFGSKSGPKTKTRNLDDILGRMSEDEAGLSKASILQKGVHIAMSPHKENALTFLFNLLGDRAK